MITNIASLSETALPETMIQVIRSRWLGDIEFDAASELLFPVGLPGFESERRMLPVEIPAQTPLVYLQSLTRSDICFVALPVFVVNPDFRLSLSEEERSALQFPEEFEPQIGMDVLCLALLMPSRGTFRVNLDVPVVINLHNGRALQCVEGAEKLGSFRLDEDGRWERAC